MDSIGSEQFIRLAGDLPSPATQLEEVTRPSIDGVAYRVLGERARPTTLQGLVDVASSAAADGKRATYAALVGTVVTVTIRGQAQADVLVLAAEVTARKQLAAASGGIAGGTWLVESQWLVQYAG